MTQLPPEAGGFNSGLFEPDDDWLASAPKELQIAAMRRWFLDRYEDPANETPWDGEGKEYVFVWGGPYDPDDEIQSSFNNLSRVRDVIQQFSKGNRGGTCSSLSGVIGGPSEL
ncbi:hypothetical protein [Acidithiobacillus thiooxidans]|uniref:hypothetical protein n=1 Tax=Acidithiobacillus thiooxidans TaxID=930 RepID=UPI001111CA95|nr:hypothetical protein [Acidithiobacillus thiooxidans]